MADLLKTTEHAMLARARLSAGQGMLVAVSGGLDSVVLLHLLHALAVKRRWKLIVAHFNHQLRGAASDGDERFVRRLAARLNLPCVTGRGDVRAHARDRALSLEMAARELRHAFLARAAKRRRVSLIALAHHADDQVELFFLRLLRGAGGEGLAGMKWRAPSPGHPKMALIRPLLDRRRAELEEYARKNRICFRRDASNVSRDILRNRIRHELLPWLRRHFQPAVDRTVLRLMDILCAESEVLARLTQAHLRAKRPPPFATLPVALQRRVLQARLQRQHLAPDFDRIEWLRLNPGRPLSVSPALSVERDAQGLLRVSKHAPLTFQPGQTTLTLGGLAGECVFDGVRIRWRIDTGRHTARPPRPGCEFFDADQVGAQVVLRHWRAGDRFQPIGVPGRVKLQDWFTNRKLGRDARRQLLVAATAAGEIFWVEDQRIGECCKLTSRTRRRLTWRWERL